MVQAQTFDGTEVLRLEVEQPTEGLANLVRNPSGELGGWGWLSPVANTSVGLFGTPAAPSLEARTTAAQAVHVLTELLPVTAGHYIAARLSFSASTMTHVRLRFRFVNAAGAEVSLSAQSGYIGIAGGATAQLSPVLIPAGAAYAQLRLDLYSSGAGANPLANTYAVYREVTVATSPSSTGLGSSRTNVCPNPSFEVDMTGWVGASAINNGPAVRTSEWSSAGGWSRKMTRAESVDSSSQECMTPSIAVTPGQQYAVQAVLRVSAMANPGLFYLGAEWTNSSGTVFSSTLVWSTARTTAAGGVRFGNVLTVPANAVSARFRFRSSSMEVGESFYLDSCLIELGGEVLGPYFDGSTPDAGGVDYAWTGTAHASTSTAIAGAQLAYIPPTTWLDVLGPTHSIEVVREALQTGTLTATVLDATLAPYQADGIKPGRACRLLAMSSAGAWRPLFTGELDTAAVTFDRQRLAAGDGDPKRARVSLVAVDAAATLAGVTRPEGVSTVDELPYVLEGAGVPWDVNGSGDQIGFALVTTVNENASALDQVALTRDTALGYAWVDTRGVLRAYDAADMPAVVESLTEAEYSDLDLGYDSTACINTVTVTQQTYDSTTGTTEEVTHGPYVDSESVATYGVRAATFTTAPFLVADGEPVAASYAADVLAANATPRVRASSVTVPILDSALHLVDSDGSRVAFLDLYSLVEVSNTSEAYSEQQRVTSIRHIITAKPRTERGTWRMVVGFAAEGEVAQPGTIPSPGQGAGGLTLAQTLRPIGEVTMWYGDLLDLPGGWLPCTGAAIPAEYPELIAMVGPNTPNLVDRFPIGAGTKALGTSGGSPTFDVGSHQHNATGLSTGAAQGMVDQTAGSGGAVNLVTRASANSHTHNVTGQTGGGGAHTVDTMPPWRALWFIIRAK